MAPEPDCVWALGAKLGEGPVWSARDHAVWFVDTRGPRVHRFEPRTGAQRSWEAPSQPGFVLPSSDGKFIAGLETGLHHFDPASGAFRHFSTVEDASLGNRLNDGHVDAEGRLWFGSMHASESAPTGALYRRDHDGRLHRLDEGIPITNGPATSPDGRTFFHTDTIERTIYAYDLAASGALSNKRVFTRIEQEGAWPDGNVVDSEGCLWTGLWGGGCLARFSPAGELVQKIVLPCSNVTKAAFGGDDLRTLYITTALKGLDAKGRASQPLAGGLFAVRVETPGQPQHEVRL